MQVDSGLYAGSDKALINFQATLPHPQSDLAQQILKDPYNPLDFALKFCHCRLFSSRGHGMSISVLEIREAFASTVRIGDDSLVVDLYDGRTITVPLAWFPRLARGTPAQRENYCLIGGGTGLHWPDLDEDISVESLLAGRRSGETQQSLRSWLASRTRA